MSRTLELFAFADTLDLARQVGERIGSEVQSIDVHRFPDGESLVRAIAHGSERAVVFRSLDHPNDKLVELLLAADALRQQGVKSLTLVAPYLGYMRQDRIFHPGEALSQRVVARMIESAFDDVLTVEAHLHRIHRLSEIFSCPATSFSAAEPIADWIRRRAIGGVVIGPDAESEPWIEAVARGAGLPGLVCSKLRRGDRDVRIELPPLPPDTRCAWIVDDIGSSGATLETIVELLAARGVESVRAILVHALLDPEAHDRLARAGLSELVSCDSIPHPTNAIPLAPLLAEALAGRDSAREAG